MERGKPSILRNWIVSALLFGLFAEWLRPLTWLEDYTEIRQLFPILGAIAVYLAIDASGIRGVAAWPLKMGFTVGWIGYWFQRDVFTVGAWWKEAVRIAREDAVHAAAGIWMVSPEMRTFLFLAGWAALAYAVQRMAVERGQALWFVAATLLYLILLQLWPGLSTGDGVLRTAALGLLLLTVLNGIKWQRLLDLPAREGWHTAFVRNMAGILCASAVLLLGYGLSAGQPKEVEPISFDRWGNWVRAAAELPWLSEGGHSMTASVSRTGFSEDDRLLGRPVTPDPSIAFEAETERPTYWRGDTRDLYTGKGWRSSAAEDRAQRFQSLELLEEGAAAEVQTITVVDPGLSTIIFAGGPVLRFLELEQEDGSPLSDIHIRFHPDSDSYRIGTDGVALGKYRMETLPFATDADQLALDQAEVQPAPSGRYLQLPEELPERVRRLAEEIVADLPDNRYVRAKAIETYLKVHYTYSLEPALPPQDADFVDYFLFEGKQGYCDHFSTAMVVLLRAAGMEARWVKGYAPGTPDPERPGTYIVRQSDAHSWVEVRFAAAGWVPFEPTPSTFTAQLMSGTEAEAAFAPAAEQATRLPASPPARFAAWLAAAYDRAAQLGSAAGMAAAGIAAAAVGLVAAGYAAVRLLRRRRPAVQLPPYAAAARPAAPEQRRLDRLWRRLYRAYGPPARGETLREYAERCLLAAKPEARAALIELMRYDESIRYGGGRIQRMPSRWYADMLRRLVK